MPVLINPISDRAGVLWTRIPNLHIVTAITKQPLTDKSRMSTNTSPLCQKFIPYHLASIRESHKPHNRLTSDREALTDKSRMSTKYGCALSETHTISLIGESQSRLTNGREGRLANLARPLAAGHILLLRSTRERAVAPIQAHQCGLYMAGSHLKSRSRT